MKIQICPETHEIEIYVGILVDNHLRTSREIAETRSKLEVIKGVDYVLYNQGYFNVVPKPRFRLESLAKRIKKALGA